MIDLEVNYLGVIFYGIKTDTICSCCIHPPDYIRSWGRNAKDEFPVTLVLWSEDTPDYEVRKRVHLSSIITALAVLFSAKCENAPYCIVELSNRPDGNRLMSNNLHLWRSTFTRTEFEYKKIHSIHDLDELIEDFAKRVVVPIPVDKTIIYARAATEWDNLVKKTVMYLLNLADSAANYLLIKPMLDEWLHYSYEYPTTEITHKLYKLFFLPWYADVIRSRPILNPEGLRLVVLESQKQYALYDYFPERERKLYYETIQVFPENAIRGKVKLYEPQDEGAPLPYDEKKHLHLLPIRSDNYWLSIDDIPGTMFFDEDWLN